MQFVRISSLSWSFEKKRHGLPQSCRIQRGFHSVTFFFFSIREEGGVAVVDGHVSTNFLPELLLLELLLAELLLAELFTRTLRTLFYLLKYYFNTRF